MKSKTIDLRTNNRMLTLEWNTKLTMMSKGICISLLLLFSHFVQAQDKKAKQPNNTSEIYTPKVKVQKSNQKVQDKTLLPYLVMFPILFISFLVSDLKGVNTNSTTTG